MRVFHVEHKFCVKMTVVWHLHCTVSKCRITLFLLHVTCDSALLKVTVTVWGWTTLLFTFQGEVNLSSWQEVRVGVVGWHGLLHHSGCTPPGKTCKADISFRVKLIFAFIESCKKKKKVPSWQKTTLLHCFTRLGVVSFSFPLHLLTINTNSRWLVEVTSYNYGL